MSDYKYQNKLREIIKSYKKTLKNNIKLEIKMFRDYLVKVELFIIKNNFKNKSLGKINFYFSPKKNKITKTFKEFSLENDKTLIKNNKNNYNNKNYNNDKLIEVKSLDVFHKPKNPNKIFEAYVDGSFKNESAGYGIVVFCNNKVVQKISGNILIEDLSSRNIIGELFSVMRLIDYCKKVKIKKIKIYHDYNGISKFVKGNWKARVKITKKYQNYMKKIKNLEIEFKKVKSHSGVKGNQIADRLAKKGTFLREYMY